MDILEGFKLCRKGFHWYPVVAKGCPACKLIKKLEWEKNNRDHMRSYQQNYLTSNREKIRKYKKEYYRNRSPEILKTAKQTYQGNKEKKLNANKQWKSNNKDKVNAYIAKRRAAKKQAIPSWANIEKIKEIYRKAEKLTTITGIEHQVDHIYPLQSKYMCGLHVETNLQILTKEENASKGNRTWPGQLDCQKD